GVERELITLLQPARFAHELEQEFEVIAIRRGRAFMDEALDRERNGARSWCPPRACRNLQRQLRLRDAHIRHQLRRELVRAQVAAARRSVAVRRERDEMIAPRDQLAGVVYAA